MRTLRSLNTISSFLLILIALCCACEDQTTRVSSEESVDQGAVGEMTDSADQGDVDTDTMMGGEEESERADQGARMSPVDRTDELYQTDRLLEVDITMDPEDWAQLRGERRRIVELFGGEDCLDEPFGSPYTWFEASVTLDGEVFPRVEVKKKGFVGSVNDEKPGLKIDLGEFDRELNYLGARRITLNNSVQDPALIRQCLGYELTREAGIPAPRCNFARVTVNDEPLGLYVNLESYKRPFFEHHFGSYDGNLYEGTISDFTERGINTFEPKNGDEERSPLDDIDAVQAALDGGDDELLERLSEVIDLDGFFRFWALESLLAHSDGYSGNRNNFYLYGDPALDGRLVFLMWGIDGVFGAYNVAEEEPKSVYRRSAISWRLYRHPEGRRRYFEALDPLLETLWDEERILARIETYKELISGWVSDEAKRIYIEQEIDQVAAFVEERRSEIEGELEEGEPDAGEPPSGPACLLPSGSVSASFSTTWGLINRDPEEWFIREGQTFDVTFAEEEDPTILSVGSAAGSDFQYGPRLNVVGSLGLNAYLLLNVSLSPENWRSGVQEVWSELYYSGPESNYQIVYIASAFIEMDLEEGGAEADDEIVGRLSGDLLAWGE